MQRCGCFTPIDYFPFDLKKKSPLSLWLAPLFLHLMLRPPRLILLLWHSLEKDHDWLILTDVINPELQSSLCYSLTHSHRGWSERVLQVFELSGPVKGFREERPYFKRRRRVKFPWGSAATLSDMKMEFMIVTHRFARDTQVPIGLL